MTFDEYMEKAIGTDVFGGRKIDTLIDPAFLEKVLGLSGEAGEVADKVKKIIRDRDGIATEENLNELMKELGDTLWYVATVAHCLGYSLDEVAKANLAKLADRHKRNLIHGAGDNR